MIILVYSVMLRFGSSPLLTIFVAVYCSELQCVAASCSVLQQIAVCCSKFQCVVLYSRSVYEHLYLQTEFRVRTLYIYTHRDIYIHTHTRCVYEHLYLQTEFRVRTLYIYTHRDIYIHTHTRCANEHSKYTYIIACVNFLWGGYG